MIGKITIFCFAASYAVTLALEITRLFFRSGVRGALMLVFAGAGIAAQTLFLLHRWTAESIPPLSSEFDWYLVAAWLLALCYLVLVFFHPRNSIGIFCLPLVLGLIGLAWSPWTSHEPLSAAAGARFWRWAHGGSLLIGTVAVMIGFAAGLMYLLHDYRLKHKLPPRRGLALPSLEWLGRVSERAIVASAACLLCGFGTGLMLSRLAYGTVLWTDPVVWSSTLLAAWMALVATFNFAYKPARQGRKVAYLTVGTFLFLAMTLGALLVGHQPADGAGTPANPVKQHGGAP